MQAGEPCGVIVIWATRAALISSGRPGICLAVGYKWERRRQAFQGHQHASRSFRSRTDNHYLTGQTRGITTATPSSVIRVTPQSQSALMVKPFLGPSHRGCSDAAHCLSSHARAVFRPPEGMTRQTRLLRGVEIAGLCQARYSDRPCLH